MHTDLVLLRLLTFLSPAFPTGAYAFSHGLEWAVEAGDVTDATTLTAWIGDLLERGSLRNDAILLRHAWRGAHDANELACISIALSASRERADEACAQGNAFQRAARPWLGQAPDLPLPVAVGIALRRIGADERTVCLAYLHAAVANLVSAGVRLIPLGQTDGLRVQASLEDSIIELADRTAAADLDDLGGVCLRADLAAMHHETQATRLFRS
jgi:urease accessory protein